MITRRGLASAANNAKTNKPKIGDNIRLAGCALTAVTLSKTAPINELPTNTNAPIADAIHRRISINIDHETSHQGDQRYRCFHGHPAGLLAEPGQHGNHCGRMTSSLKPATTAVAIAA